MNQTLEILASLAADGYITRYCLGGAVAALYYSEPFDTEDLDIFVILPLGGHPLDPLGPLYAVLREHGYAIDGVHVVIEGVPVQFLPAYNALVVEALEHSTPRPFLNQQVPIPSPEHLVAIMVDTGRDKDRLRVSRFIDEVELDPVKLADILARHGLTERHAAWTRT